MISRGDTRGRISLEVKAGVFWVNISGDPRGDDMVAAFREARRSNLLSGPTPTLVDMLDFNGSIDWRAIGAIREMTPWERSRVEGGGDVARESPPLTRCAYVSRDPLLAPVIKIICDLFGRTRHRQFRDKEQAMLWVLQTELPPPELAELDEE